MKINTEFGKTIKLFRQKYNLTQEEFAHKLGVSFTSVNRWENGHANPNRLATKIIKDLWREYGFEDYSEKTGEKSLKVLIVDDEVDVARFIKASILRSNPDMQIEQAYDGYEAGQKVISFKPNIIILDIFLPGIKGDQICINIKANKETSDIKIIAISGQFTEDLTRNLIDQGVDAIVEKPVEIGKLLDTINSLNLGVEITY